MAGASKKKAKRGGTRAKAPARVRPAVSRTKKPSPRKTPAKKRASTPRTPSPKKRSPAKKVKLPKKKAHRSPAKHRAQSKIAPKKKKLPKKSHRSTAKQTKRGHLEHLAQRGSRDAERRKALADAKTAATAKRRVAALKGWKAHRIRQREGFDGLRDTLTWYKDRGESSSYELFRNLKRQLFETNDLPVTDPNYLDAETIENILIQAALDAGWDELHAARFAKDS